MLKIKKINCLKKKFYFSKAEIIMAVYETKNRISLFAVASVVFVLGFLVARPFQVASQITQRNYKVWYDEYPSGVKAYPLMTPCVGCDLMRCLMGCNNDEGCNAMGFGTANQGCNFLIGRVLNASAIQSSPGMNYYEKSCKLSKYNVISTKKKNS